jgi:hypothetical protein
MAMFKRDGEWRKETTLAQAVRRNALSSDIPSENIEALAEMIAAMLEVMPPSEQLRVLNAGAVGREWDFVQGEE